VTVAITLIILGGAVIWGCIADHLRHLDNRHNRDDDDRDHHRALLREIRRHDVNQQRGTE
jgi:hypothetical protein